MARYLSRALFATTKQSVFSVVSRSNTTAASSAVIPNSSSLLFRTRPLVAAISYYGRLAPSLSTRGFATRQTSSSLSDPNPNWSNRPPKETILLEGCDFEHWLIVMEKPEGDPTRDEIIDSYIKTLAMVVGSEEEARMKMYSVSTRHYFAFGALVTEEVSHKIKELPKVRWVLPDSYLDVRNKDYGGEPFIDGQAVPYDPKYHEEWVRNNARANERNRRNDRPRNFDRSRNFDRRREGQMSNNQNPGGPGSNMGAQPNPPPNSPGASNMGAQHGYAPNNPGNYPQRGPANNAQNYQYGPGPNNGGAPAHYQSGPGPNQNQRGFVPGVGPNQGQNQNAYANAPSGGGGGGYPSYQNQNVTGRDMPQLQNPGPNNFSQNRGFGPGPNSGNYAGPNGSGSGPNMGHGPGQNQNSYAPNVGQNQNGYGGTSQNQNVPGRDFPTNY